MAEPVTTAAPPKARAAQAHFDRWAKVYGRSRLLDRLQRKALAELQPRPQDRILDVGCGAGGLVAEVGRTVERAVGVDLSPGMLELARSRYGADPELRNIEFRLAPADALPFEDRSFTGVVCTTALHHFPDPDGAAREMARVVAPGGRVVIGDVSRDSLTAKLLDPLFRRLEKGHVGLHRRREIEALLTHAGLRVAASRRVWILVYALVRAERPAQ